MRKWDTVCSPMLGLRGVPDTVLLMRSLLRQLDIYLGSRGHRATLAVSSWACLLSFLSLSSLI